MAIRMSWPERKEGEEGGKGWPWRFWGQVGHLISPSDLQSKWKRK